VAVLCRNSPLVIMVPSTAAAISANPVLARASRSPAEVASEGMAMACLVPAVADSSVAISAVTATARPARPMAVLVVRSLRNSACSCRFIRAFLGSR